MRHSSGYRSGPEIGPVRLSPGNDLFLILGPCVIESEDLVFEVAGSVAALRDALQIPVVFKASFDKANRTSVTSFRGPGPDEGLEILLKVREKFGLAVTTDVHGPDQAREIGPLMDLIQIPAFLCRQTDLLTAAGSTGKPVNIKKGQFLAPDDMAHAARKVLDAGGADVILTERGTTFGYHDLVTDMRSIVRMQELGYPVVFDATHSVQLPGGGEGCSGGERGLIPHLARAAVAAGADGVFMEVHPDPDRALCDGPNSLHLQDLNALARNLKALFELVPREKPAEGYRSSGSVTVREPAETFTDRLKRIRMIIFDVDGILTDGRITYGSGDLEIKSFDVRDGHGIKLASRVGLQAALVTGRQSEATPRRAEELGITHVYQGIWNKREALTDLREKTGFSLDEIAMVGDDVVDIPIMRQVGASFTVPGVPEEVRRSASYVTRNGGGRGAAREVIEMILKAQGLWGTVMERYYSDPEEK